MTPFTHASASLLLSLLLVNAAHANDHKLLGVIALPRNETNDLTLKLPVCRSSSVSKSSWATVMRSSAGPPSTLKQPKAPARVYRCHPN
jgi:hypothetical protein